MAYSEKLALQVNKILVSQPNLTSKKMFGGLAFMVNGNMVCGVSKDELLLRVNPEVGERLTKETGVRMMNHNGKVMKGFLYVDKTGYKDNKGIEDWIKIALDFVLTLPKK